MRKLVLQMHMTLDGFAASPDGGAGWIWASGPPDEVGVGKVIELADRCDIILLGRKMTPGFIKHWENVYDTQPENPLAQRMVNMRKIVFSHTETEIKGRNLEVENGDLATVVGELKKKPGKDILVYGGADFASSLISLDLVDEYFLVLNPIAIGKGLSIFKEQKILKLESSTPFNSGKILNKYLPV